MKCVEHKELVTLFDAGALKSAEIHQWGMGKGYRVEFVGTNKARYGYKAQRQAHYMREFKSLDAAMSAVAKIGFKTASVHI